MRTPISLLVAVLVMTAGCRSLDQRALDASADDAATHAERAELALRSGQYTEAIARWRSAAQALRPGSDHYLLGKLYVAHSKYEAGIGWAHLMRSEPELAGQAYRNSIESLREGFRAHKAIVRDNKEQVEMLANVAQMAVYGAATYAQARSAALSGNSYAYYQPTYVPVPDWITLPEPTVSLRGARLLNGQLEQHVVRIPVVPDRGPLRRVGRVRSKQGGWCTGSLVGPRIVLTNAHCVTRSGSPGTPLPPSELSFHLEKVRYTVSFPVRTYFTHLGERAGYATDESWPVQRRFANDWALLVIDLPPGQRLGYLALDSGLTVDSQWTPGDTLVLAGYSGDLNNGAFMTMHWGCQPLRIFGVMEYDCSGAGGSSGSPLFLVRDGRWRVVAVHACGTNESLGTRISCGPHIDAVVRQVARLRVEYPYL